jgi:hypothetical protein
MTIQTSTARTLGKGLPGDQAVNLKMLREGLAWHFMPQTNLRYGTGNHASKMNGLGAARRSHPIPCQSASVWA